MTDKTALIKAIQSENKILFEQSEKRTEVNFILNNWQIFVESKTEIYAALKGTNNLTGTDLLYLLGMRDTYIEKVSKAELLTACYKFKSSKLYDTFCTLTKKSKCGTVFFIVDKSGIVVTNQYNLQLEDTFTHIFTRPKQNDLFWAPVDEVKEKLKIYAC